MVLPVALASALALAGCSASEINSGIGVAGNLFKGFSITNEQLAAEARLSVEAMDKKQKVASAKNRYSRRLRKLTRNLQHYEGMNLNYKVYLSKTVNAFATPDGSVRVYSGLMDMMSDDELLAVIGHEIGHVKKQHSLNEYKKAYIAKAVKEGVTAYGSGTASALAGSYGDIGLQFLGAQFSQSDELEADSYGVGVLKYLGKNPCAAVSAQRKLQQLGSSGGLFSSHPSSAKRIDKLDKVTGGVCAK
ncbi:MAG: peptidase [Gammaproteobacteria bacterium]|nr:MAG: peptidase [Gammaproteobacteria bacterium]